MREPSDVRQEGFLPWHEEVASSWLGKRDRFAHAWLIHGATGIGKTRFARAAAASLLCETPMRHLACGTCQACQWLRHGNHPDLRMLRPDAVALAEGEGADEEAPVSDKAKKAPSREIRVDHVRALESWLNVATHRGGARVVLLYPAESLNSVSANAMLKILEEPPPGTIFLLVADKLDRLLPTLVSRCRRLPLAAPDANEARRWLDACGVDNAGDYLAAAGGTPLTALRMFQAGEAACPAWLRQFAQALAERRTQACVPRLVDELEKVPAATWIDALQRLFADLLWLHSTGAVRYYPGLAPSLAALANRLPAVTMAEAARWLGTQRDVAAHPLNPRLFVHSVLLRLAAIES